MRESCRMSGFFCWCGGNCITQSTTAPRAGSPLLSLPPGRHKLAGALQRSVGDVGAADERGQTYDVARPFT